MFSPNRFVNRVLILFSSYNCLKVRVKMHLFYFILNFLVKKFAD